MQSGTFRLMKAEVRDLTRELAEAFHQMAPSPTERELNSGRLKMLREKAEANQLISFMWSKALLNDQWIRVNGQHSSQMLVELEPATFPTGLKVHLDEYEVADLHGLAQLFRQFDERKSGRSLADVAGAYQNIVPELEEVARPIGKLAIDGVSWYRLKIEKAPSPKGDNQYTLFHEFALHDFIKWTNEVFSIKTPEMKSQAVVAAMYASFEAYPTEARKFWESVSRGGDQYDDTAPSTVLDEWLKGIKRNHTRPADFPKTDPLTPAQIYQGCVYAYNAYRKGQALKVIRHDFKTYPEPIGQAA